MRNLSEIRTEIDSIDEQIIELFKKRMECAIMVAVSRLLAEKKGR